MNKVNSINYIQIKKLLLDNSLNVNSSIDDKTIFYKIDTLNNSNKNDLTFFHNIKYLNQLKNTKAKACLIESKYTSYLNQSCIPITVEDPYRAYALISNLIYPILESNGLIHETVLIDSNSNIKNNVQINSNSVINKDCLIHENVIIYNNSIIGPNVEIGKNSIIMSNCSISNTILGSDCIIQSGAVIGKKGFGFTPKEKIDIQHIGNVCIGDNVDIGSNTTIDRGTINATIIGDNCRIDNLVQIAHNVKIGNNCTIAAQTGISGSTILGNNCLMGGQVGIAGHLKIGDNVVIAAKSGVTKDIISNSRIAGFPARDIKLWKKSVIKQFKDIK